MIRFVLLISVLSVADSFLHCRPLPLPDGSLLVTSNLLPGTFHNTPCSAVHMARKPLEEKPKDDNESKGIGRFMGGIFRSDKESDTVKKDEKDEEESTVLKNISKRLTFRREPDPGDVSDDKLNPPSKFNQLRESFSKIWDSKDSAEKKDSNAKDKRLEELRKQMKSNQQRQKEIAAQKKRDKELEVMARKEEERLAAAIAKVEAEQKREQERLNAERQKRERAQGSVTKKEEKTRASEPKIEADRKREQQLKMQSSKEEDTTPQLMKSSSKKAQSEDDDTKEKSEEEKGFFSKAVSGVWDAAAGAFSKNAEEWVIVLPKTRVSPGEIVPIQVRGIDLLVVASRDGKIHCLANSCSHLGTPLETGLLESRPVEDAQGVKKLTAGPTPQVECEDCIVCPLHKTAFSLESGEVRGEWCPYPPVLGSVLGKSTKKSPVAVFDIRTKGKFIEIRLNSSLDPSGTGDLKPKVSR